MWLYLNGHDGCTWRAFWGGGQLVGGINDRTTGIELRKLFCFHMLVLLHAICAQASEIIV